MKVSKGLIGAAMLACFSAHAQVDTAVMMFELHEAASCKAAASYLKDETRLAVHKDDWQALLDEYQVPEEVASSIIRYNERQYHRFLERYDERYPDLDKQVVLTSAYTHRCYFMNDHESRRAAAIAAEIGE